MVLQRQAKSLEPVGARSGAERCGALEVARATSSLNSCDDTERWPTTGSLKGPTSSAAPCPYSSVVVGLLMRNHDAHPNE